MGAKGGQGFTSWGPLAKWVSNKFVRAVSMELQSIEWTVVG